jgi:hypothetical protein
MQTRAEGRDLANEQFCQLSDSRTTYLRNIAKGIKDDHPDKQRAYFRLDVSAAYNCHGLTFASRRTCIHDPQEVRRILNDDGYEKVLDKEVTLGDVILYVSRGDIEHSGVVIRTDNLTRWVLSKWGVEGPEAVHLANYCPYDWDAFEYYRVVR